MICGLTRPQDVEAALDAGADAIGVVFDRGPCRVTPKDARDLLEAARGTSVERVAVVGTASLEVRARIAELGFGVVQAVATRDLAERPGEWPLLPAFFDGPDLLDRIAAWRALFPPAPPRPGSVLGTLNVDGMNGGGTGCRADWARAAGAARGGALTLSGGLRRENLETALRAVRPSAIDVSSGVEASPGLKARDRVAAFVREARRLEEVLAEAA